MRTTRTLSQRKYRPLEEYRHKSRYGQIEIALMKLKLEGFIKFKSSDVAEKTLCLDNRGAAMIMKFTRGVRHRKDQYWEFTDEPIRVMNE